MQYYAILNPPFGDTQLQSHSSYRCKIASSPLTHFFLETSYLVSISFYGNFFKFINNFLALLFLRQTFRIIEK